MFTGLGSVDPHKGAAAVAEVANIAALGLRGVKFHPSLQAFAPDDPAYWPVFAACQEHGLLALFHTGTSGIGARQPGGQGIRLDYAHPLKLDPVAAAHPELTVVAAHFGWPWHMELVAMALHKTNVYIDISGWSPQAHPGRGRPRAARPAVRPVPLGQRLPVHHPGTLPGRTGRTSACPTCPAGCCTTTRPGSSAWITASPGAGMDFSLTGDQLLIRDAVREVCAGFPAGTGAIWRPAASIPRNSSRP